MAGAATRSVFAARAIRDFGDGFVAVILPVYLTALGMSAFEVGVVATLALLGSALLTLAIGFLGAAHDHRRLLIAASLLMTATGLAYAATNAAWVLLVVAFVGTVNPSGGSASIFLAGFYSVASAPTGRLELVISDQRGFAVAVAGQRTVSGAGRFSLSVDMRVPDSATRLCRAAHLTVGSAVFSEPKPDNTPFSCIEIVR